MSAGIRRQEGVTLVIALIFLVVITLLATSALSTTNTNLKVVGNMQFRSEALDAAQQAIEAVISSPRFLATPADAVLDPCGTANTVCTDLNNDGTPEYITELNPAPSCVSAKVIKTSELNLSRAEDLNCYADEAERLGTASGDSLCADTNWEITAQTHSTLSRTQITVTQGVAVRLSAAEARALCGADPPGVFQGRTLPPSPEIGKARADRGQKTAMSGAIERSRRAPSSVGTQTVHPKITQDRRRTYWFIHQDQ